MVCERDQLGHIPEHSHPPTKHIPHRHSVIHVNRRYHSSSHNGNRRSWWAFPPLRQRLPPDCKHRVNHPTTLTERDRKRICVQFSQRHQRPSCHHELVIPQPHQLCKHGLTQRFYRSQCHHPHSQHICQHLLIQHSHWQCGYSQYPTRKHSVHECNHLLQHNQPLRLCPNQSLQCKCHHCECRIGKYSGRERGNP